MENLEKYFEEACEAIRLRNYTGFYDFILEVVLISKYTKTQVGIDISEEVFLGFFCSYSDSEGSSAVFHCYFY